MNVTPKSQKQKFLGSKDTTSKLQFQENSLKEGSKEYMDYLSKLKILEEIRLKKLQALELLGKFYNKVYELIHTQPSMESR